MRGYTKKPCHGCGEIPSNVHGRPTEGLCNWCADLLQFGKDIKAHQARLTGLSKVYSLPWSYYSLPHIPHGDVDNENGRGFQRTFFDLIRLIAEPNDLLRRFPLGQPLIDGMRDSRGTARLDPAIRETLNNLYEDIVNLSKTAYAKGRKDGSSFLAKLARGELTIEELNKAAVG